jgi:hypothetical protein
MLKNKTDSNENDFKLINEKYYLYDKSNDLKKRNINSANPNKFDKKNNFKKIYILSKSENKKHNNNNNTFLYGKNQLKFNIKNTPFQQKFTLIEQMNKTSIDNYFPKLLPKNIFNNNSNEDRYFHFLKKNKTNYSIQNENNKNNNNIINFRTIINSFIKIKNSKNDFYNNIDIIINNNKNKGKTHNNKFFSSNKICRTSNCCDASTNTNYENGFFKNKIINFNLNGNHNKGLKYNYNHNTSNSKKRKRPLMIDYFYSEHKKFCYGFDKLRGKNKIKRPLFIVHKY